MMHTQPIMWTAYPKILQICPNEEIIRNYGSHRIDEQNAPYSRSLMWPQMGFARVSVKISADLARVSAKWSLRREEGHDYWTYVNNTLLDQTKAVQYFRLRFFSALRTDRMIGRHELFYASPRSFFRKNAGMSRLPISTFPLTMKISSAGIHCSLLENGAAH